MSASSDHDFGQARLRHRLAEVRMALGGALVGVGVVELGVAIVTLAGTAAPNRAVVDTIGAVIGFLGAWLVLEHDRTP